MKPGRLVPGAILVLLGGVFLAANLGLLEWNVVASLWQLWPLVFILIGIQLLLGEQRRWLATLLVLLLLAGGAALVVSGRTLIPGVGAASRTTVAIESPSVGDVEKAVAHLDIEAARLVVGSQSGPLLAAGTYETRHTPEVTHEVAGDTYTLDVRSEAKWRLPFGKISSDKVTLELVRGVPWTIAANIAATDANLDLSDLTLEGLTLNADAASLDLRVGPDVVDGAEVRVECNAASVRLRLPRDLDITLSTSSDLSSLDVDSSFDRVDGGSFHHDGGRDRLDVSIDANVSSVSIDLY